MLHYSFTSSSHPLPGVSRAYLVLPLLQTTVFISLLLFICIYVQKSSISWNWSLINIKCHPKPSQAKPFKKSLHDKVNMTQQPVTQEYENYIHDGINWSWTNENGYREDFSRMQPANGISTHIQHTMFSLSHTTHMTDYANKKERHD